MQGILLALMDRERSGLGQHVDIALFDAMLSVMRLPLGVLLATGADPSRVGNDHLSIAPYESLRAKDGYIIVAVANPRGCGAASATRSDAQSCATIRDSRPTLIA